MSHNTSLRDTTDRIPRVVDRLELLHAKDHPHAHSTSARTSARNRFSNLIRIAARELNNDRNALENQGTDLIARCRRERSELVLLPEMPFSPWLAANENVDQSA